MITHIKTTGFKGHDIDEPVAQKTIYVGPNGSGKSERAQAIALATMGYVPWASKPKKKPADIVEAYGNGQSIAVAATINGVEFERKFVTGTDGKTSQKFRINKRKSDKDEFARDMTLAGNPTIFDLGAFMDLSDQRKIDTIFSYFPPQGDVSGLDDAIQTKTEELNGVNYKINTLNGVINRLTSSKSSIELPAGSLPEIRAEIERKTADVQQAHDELKAEEIRIAQEEAVLKIEEERQSSEFTPPANTLLNHPDVINNTLPIPQGIMNQQEAEKAASTMINRNPDIMKPSPDPAGSIMLILSTLGNAGCESCAAVLVAKRELLKYRGR